MVSNYVVIDPIHACYLIQLSHDHEIVRTIMHVDTGSCNNNGHLTKHYTYKCWWLFLLSSYFVGGSLPRILLKTSLKSSWSDDGDPSIPYLNALVNLSVLLPP